MQGTSRKLQNFLGTGVIRWRTDVDEYPVLLLSVNTATQHIWENVFLQAGWPLWDVIEYGAVKHVNPAVYKSSRLTAGFFCKASYSATLIHLHGPVSAGILNTPDGHGCNRTVVGAMKGHEALKIDFKERVPVQHQELMVTFEVGLRQLDGAASAQRHLFFRILDRDVPRPAVSEFAFNLISHITGAKHEMANSLRTELRDQQFQE